MEIRVQVSQYVHDRIVALRSTSAPSVPVADAPGHLVARDALVELGYTVLDAERALAEIDPELPAEERVRLVLRGAAA